MHRAVTHSPQVSPSVAGQFAETASYSTWRPGGTNDYLLILTVSGGGVFGHASGGVIVAPGDLVILRPGTPHDYATARRAGGWEIIWAHFLPRPHWHDYLAGLPEAVPGIARLALGTNNAASRAVQDALGSMNNHANGGRARATDFAMNALEAALLYADVANPQASARAIFDTRILHAMEFLRGEKLAVSVSLADIAGTVNLSPSRLLHLFKAQTGSTPGQFQETERLLRARKLLALTNRSVAAIAGEVGFASPFYFTLRFKKNTGQSPRDFRRAEQERQNPPSRLASAGDAAILPATVD